MTAVRFSVVVPLFNKEAFIGRALDSILAQTCAPFEVIVVDDGSTDRGAERVLRYSDPRLRLIRSSNRGPGAARSLGMDSCTGEWIAFQDADDYWFPDHLQELSRMAIAFPEAGMLATANLEGRDANALQPRQPRAKFRQIDYFRAAAKDIGVICSSSVAIRRAIVLRLGSFLPCYNGEDLEYWARVALIAPVVKSDRVTVYYFRNDESVMAMGSRAAPNAGPADPLEAWPSVALLERAKDAPEHRRLRRSMERYQRTALYLTMIGHMVRGQIADARQIATLLPGRYLDRAALLAVIVRLPKGLLCHALSAWISVRHRDRRSID